ncbi:MAG: DUF3336 domain-containing protein [Oleiphilaceae bacterium]|nr:DUF3336 domain-containing protein [Oleiphilaceae bacterium]
MPSKKRKHLQRQLNNAESYEQWYEAAEALDDMDGLLAWRAKSGTELLHETLIQDHIRAMRRQRQSGNVEELARVMQEGLYRHLGELSNPDLYAVARTGTKYLATEFLAEIESSMNFICDHTLPGVSDGQKLQLFRDAERIYGRPALMLSGGAAFGVYHLGVTRALWRQQLLPDVLAGSSMGAIVAGAICSRNDRELADFFEQPGKIHLQAFRWLPLSRIWQEGSAMDQNHLHHHIRTNMGSVSFEEAARHSGRTLNISVSPTRTLQRPRLLNELTAPEVLVDYAVLASCAVPGIYPPVTLQGRHRDGQAKDQTPYMPTERWIDGSVHGDLPLMRMARLHNINKTLVSQANPHVLPFISHHHERGPKASLKQAAASLMHAQVATTLELTRNSWTSSMLRPLLEQAHAMATQKYLGDINIQFPFRLSLYRKVLANPSRQDLDLYLRLGEQATWPRLPMISDQTRVSRTFAQCIQRLKKRASAERQDKTSLES